VLVLRGSARGVVVTAPDAQPPAVPHVIPPIPELYWDGIQFYLPAKDDEGTDGYSVMYLSHGSWAYQGWVDAPSEDCPVVPVAAASAALDGTPAADRTRLFPADPEERRSVAHDMSLTRNSRLAAEIRRLRALLASTPTRTEESP